MLQQDARFRFVQVYSGTMRAMGEQAVAVEAMSSEADAWNNMQGINVLQAAFPTGLAFSIRRRWKRRCSHWVLRHCPRRYR